MAEHTFEQNVILLLVNDALEASDKCRMEATFKLLDAAATLIVHAEKQEGCDARELVEQFATYLISHVDEHAQPCDEQAEGE